MDQIRVGEVNLQIVRLVFGIIGKQLAGGSDIGAKKLLDRFRNILARQQFFILINYVAAQFLVAFVIVDGVSVTSRPLSNLCAKISQLLEIRFSPCRRLTVRPYSYFRDP